MSSLTRSLFVSCVGLFSAASAWAIPCTQDTECDDGVACTTDVCSKTSVCTHTPDDGACDDGAFCNGSETCDAVNDCQAGTPPDADDGVGCTVDTCDEVNDVIVNTPDDGACDDGLFCTGVETCDAVNDCQAGTPPDADDGVGCTVDTCDEVNDVIVNTPDDGACDDLMFCTGVETCDAINDCQPGTPIPGCCKADAQCNDGDACNGDETCDVGTNTCLAGTPLVCDDGNACTADSCDSGSGCVNVDISASCNDGNVCTSDSCNPATGCVNTDNSAPCSDNLFCNGADTCSGGSCSLHAGDPCGGGMLCNEGLDACVQCLDSQTCIDGDVCTDDVCLPSGSCANPFNTAPCEAGNLCLLGDTCNGAGVCEEGADLLDCVDDIFCTVDSCDPIQGCLHDDSGCLGVVCINQLNDSDGCTEHQPENCYGDEDSVCVTVDASELGDQKITGAQLFIEYDETKLQFEGIGPGDHPIILGDTCGNLDGCKLPELSPFRIPIFQCRPPNKDLDCDDASDTCTPTLGQIIYAVVIPFGFPATSADTTLATIKFKQIGAGGPATITISKFNAGFCVAGFCDGGNFNGDACGNDFDCLDRPITQLVDEEGNARFTRPCDPGNPFELLTDPDAPIFDPEACADTKLPADPGQCVNSSYVPTCFATDNGCDQDDNICSFGGVRDDGLLLSDPFPVGTTCITWTAEDCACNEATHTQCITVNDDERPTISCTADITAQKNDVGNCGANVTYPDPVANDNCPGVSFVCSPASGSKFPVGTTVVTCTATDASQNTQSCSFSVTVIDNEDPTITCTADITVKAPVGDCEADVAVPSPTCSDNCGCTTSCVRGDGLSFIDPYPVGPTTITCTATDPAGNTATCTHLVTVLDNEDPTITCTADIKRPTDRAICGNGIKGGENGQGTHCIGGPNDGDPCLTDADCEGCGAVVTYPAPVADDNCDGVTFNCIPASGSFFVEGTTPVTCTATDASGNTAFCTFNVTVNDTESPTFKDDCPLADITATTDPGECTATIVPVAPACNDNCSCSVSCSRSDGLDCFLDPYDSKSDTTLTWTATDITGNTATCTQLVRVTDLERPTFKEACPRPDILAKTDVGECTATVEPQIPDCNDNCSCSVSCRRSDGLDCGTDPYPSKNDTILTWTATDNSGNTATCTQLVRVTDNEDPAITCPLTVTVKALPGACDADVTPPTPTCTDNCTCATSCVRADSLALTDPYPVGTTVINCTATDNSGNTDSCPFDVIVLDNEAPVIPPPPDITAVKNDIGDCGAVVCFSDPVFSDNCPGATIECSPPSCSLFPVGTSTVTCTATDASGNTSSAAFDITVIDNEDPIITCSGDVVAKADEGVCGANVFYSDPLTADNCPGVTFDCVPASGSFFPDGITTVTCTATDASGNTDSCTFDVIVNDNEDPVITCPPPLVAKAAPGECEVLVPVGDIPTASCSDNCKCSTVCTRDDGLPLEDPYPVGTNIIMCAASDNSGNTAACLIEIIVLDNEEPTFGFCPEDKLLKTNSFACVGGFCEGGPNVGVVCTVDRDCVGDCGATIPRAEAQAICGDNCSLASCVCDFDRVPCGDVACVGSVCDRGPDAGSVCKLDADCAKACDSGPFVDEACEADQDCIDITADVSFPIGFSSVTCWAEDESGNVNHACVYDVLVTDNEPPIAIVPGDLVAKVDLGACCASVKFDHLTDATDNCAGVMIDCVPSSGACLPPGKTTVVCTATDAAGNTDTASFNITVEENESPIVTCSEDVFVKSAPDNCGAFVDYPDPIIVDNCPGVTVQCFPASGSKFPVGTTTVTCVATDASGNTGACLFDVTVTDNVPPTITCPADVVVKALIGDCEATVSVPTATCDDNCGACTVSCQRKDGMELDDPYPVGITAIICTATDGDGTTSNCPFTVTVRDNQDPTITCPADVTVKAPQAACDAIVPALPAPTCQDDCDCSVVCVRKDLLPLTAPYPVGTTTINCTATDPSGNTDTCSFDVNVLDNENPVITCTVDVVAKNDLGLCGATVSYPDPIAADNCPGVTFDCVPPSGSFFDEGITVVTCTATDAAGNTSTCAFNVTVLDNEDPTITCPADVKVPNDPGVCGATVTYADPVADDNCPGVTFDCVPASGSFFDIGDTTVTCTATDASGNTDVCTFSVTVNDTENPMITCPLDVPVKAPVGECEAIVVLPVPTCTDNCSCTTSCVRKDGLSLTAPYPLGTTTINCTATDPAGNTDTCDFDVIVSDSEDPVITCPGDVFAKTDLGDCGAIVSYPDPIATDNCPGVTFDCVPASGSFFPEGKTPVICTATDAGGNTSNCSFNVTVTDNEEPTIACPANVTAKTEPGLCGATVTFVDPVAADNCPGVTFDCVPPSGSFFDEGTTQVWCTATDASGNSSRCDFDVIVNDNEDPMITCPADIKQPSDDAFCAGTGGRRAGAGGAVGGGNCVGGPNDGGECLTDDDCAGCGAIVSWLVPSAVDNCRVDRVECVPPSGSFFDIGDTTVTCTATDDSGNTDACTFVVTVNDTEPPVITCPGNQTFKNDPGDCQAADPNILVPQCADNCSCTVSCTRSDGLALSDPYPVGTTTRTCTASDGAIPPNQSVPCSYDVIVLDNEDPTINPMDDIETHSWANLCGAEVTWDDPIADDNCELASVSCDHVSGSFFDAGDHTVCCTATDSSGNTGTECFLITVFDTSPLDITVRLEAVNVPVCRRCISFGLCAPGEGAEPTVLEFLDGRVDDFEIFVPSDATCICAKDELHTMERCKDLQKGGPFGHRFVVAFVENAELNDSLRCCDIDNDNLCDINDFGRLFEQFLTAVGDFGEGIGGTSCEQVRPAPPPFHSDLNCDGIVNAFDFSCIVLNFLRDGDDGTCCNGACLLDDGLLAGFGLDDGVAEIGGIAGGLVRPIRRIDVRDMADRIGFEAAQAADLDGNGVIDARDIAIFAEEEGLWLPERFRAIVDQERQAAVNGPALNSGQGR